MDEKSLASEWYEKFVAWLMETHARETSEAEAEGGQLIDPGFDALVELAKSRQPLKVNQYFFKRFLVSTGTREEWQQFVGAYGPHEELHP